MPSIKPRCVRLRCLRHQLKAAGSSARTTTFACTSYSILLRWALRYMTSTSFMFTALWLIYGPICTLIPCLVRINFGTNSLDCFIVVWLVMFAARPDLCWIITATFDLIVGLKNKGGNSWDRCAPPPLYLKQYCTVYRNIEFRSELFITIVHQCYGSGMFIPGGYWFLPISDLGSKNGNKREAGKVCFHTVLCILKSNLWRIIEFFPNKIVTYLSTISANFLKNRNGPNGIFWSWKQKVSWHCPSKYLPNTSLISFYCRHDINHCLSATNAVDHSGRNWINFAHHRTCSGRRSGRCDEQVWCRPRREDVSSSSPHSTEWTNWQLTDCGLAGLDLVLVGLTLCNVLLYYGGPAGTRTSNDTTHEGVGRGRQAISMKNFPAGSAENSA